MTPKAANNSRRHHLFPARRWVIGAAGLITLLYLVLPLIVVAVRAITGRGWQHAPEVGIPEAIALSLTTTAMSLVVTVLFGIPLAYIFARWNFRYKRALNLLVELPIVLPPAVAGLALLVTYGRRGLIGAPLAALNIYIPFSTAAVVMAQVFVSAPFFIRAAQVGFSSVPREVEDAACVDGASNLSMFRHITLPLSGRALAAGLTLSWARALGEFGATILFAGSLRGRTQTMPLLVYNVLERDLDAALWTGFLLIAMALGALILAETLRRGALHQDE